MERRRQIRNPVAAYLLYHRLWLTLFILFSFMYATNGTVACPPSEAILPCRCSIREKEIQIWCSHSNLPQIMEGIKSVERNIKGSIDELVLENNHLPALPGRFFGNLQIVRLMLRYNSIERVSNGWLNELENSLVEIYIVEPQLRSIPVESLNGMINMLALTIQSDELRHLPDVSGLLSLNYLSVQSNSLTELQPHWFRHLPKLQNVHITGGSQLNHLDAGLFEDLISLKSIDLSRNGINWIHLRAFSHLPNCVSLKLSQNTISDAGMVGRIIKDLHHLKKLRLDHNLINVVEEGSFVDLPHLTELHLNNNRITEIQYGAFLRTPMLKTIYLQHNHIKRIHPESFLQASGSGVEAMYIHNNEIEHVKTLHALLEALPTLKFLDISYNYINEITYGALRGHGTLEQLHLNNNQIRLIERDALMAMPALRELRLRNNSLNSDLHMPFWNLPGLKGLDLALNEFRNIDAMLLAGLPSLRRLDLSENGVTRIEASVFMHNPLLETLNISANALTSFHSATFRALDRLFEVDASYNHLTDIIPGLPAIVERLSFRGNSITKLPEAATNVLALPNLRMLELSVNRLEQLPKYGFQGLPQLRVLSLANNRLRGLEDTAFVGASRLELLLLQDNTISHIDERALRAMPELRNLNLQGNQLVIINDNLLSNNSRLEQLDLSRNLIRNIAPTAFDLQRSLEFLDLSDNALTDMSIGLASLINLKDIDLSYNQINRIHADVVSSWRNVIEIRLSNNLISELKQGTFRNLLKLQYLDLSSNVIASVEPGALQHLPDLQEFVLADNKLIELKDHVFEDVPNLLASHFQYNKLRFISTESFFNSPSMVFLNLSNNNFRNMDNIGLRSMRSLEVLDLSANEVRTVTTMPLKALNWLVELKMDNNQICKLHGSPFETMPRLRVLSMRNNRIRVIRENMFRKLRSNIAVLDVEGNPINCSCEMQWLSVWLQETNFPYPGPRCQDGRLLRQSRIDRKLCAHPTDNNQRSDGSSGNADTNIPNHLPLLNEHGDIFQRELLENLNEECDVYDGERPLAGESEYFYDQYVDYAPAANESVAGSEQTASSTPAALKKPPVVSYKTNAASSINANIDLNNTILNTNFLNPKGPNIATARPTNAHSPFTFFGYPIPTLSLGRFFGQGARERKDRGDYNTRHAFPMQHESRTNADISASMPATHRMNNPNQRSKTRMYQPNSAEFEKYLKTSDAKASSKQYADVNARNRYTPDVNSASEETATGSQELSGFRTAFREPSSIERGGFRPILPEKVGGFMPVHDPRRSQVEPTQKSQTSVDNEITDRNYVPVSLEGKPTISTASRESSAGTYYVSEVPTDITTSATHTTHGKRMQPTSISPTVATDYYDDDDLEAQSVSVLRPPPLLHTTTAETILLIPPPEEHVEQFKRHSWLGKTTSTTTSSTITPNKYNVNNVNNDESIQQQRTRAGGRSTITKVYTPQTLNQYLPTAEEYFRTTTVMPNNSISPKEYDNGGIEQQLTAESEATALYQQDVERKDGMDWYYDSFKKTGRPSVNINVTKRTPTHAATIFSRGNNNGNSQIFSTACYCLLIILLQF